MKKITYLLTTLLCGMVLLTACEDDRDSNPVVQQPTSFVLNEPALSGNIYDLANSSSIVVTCSQPDYGYTALVYYYAQVSLTNTWEDATDDTAATYTELDGSYNECKMALEAAALDRAILAAGGIEDESQMPAQPMTVYLRLRAALTNGYDCYSNSVTLTVKAYFTEQVETPDMWYMTGECVGDGSWGSELGVSCLPLSIVDNTVTLTGYFPAGKGFKLVKVPGGWDEQVGNSGGEGIDAIVMNDGGSSNLAVPSDGYYTITLNEKRGTVTIVPAETTPTEFEQMLIAGSFNDWATDEQMTPANTAADINHFWTYDLDVSGGDDELKFLADSGWATNWGATDFPFGVGTQGGSNIPVMAGKYTVIFNDVDGFYDFVAK